MSSSHGGGASAKGPFTSGDGVHFPLFDLVPTSSGEDVISSWEQPFSYATVHGVFVLFMCVFPGAGWNPPWATDLVRLCRVFLRAARPARLLPIMVVVVIRVRGHAFRLLLFLHYGIAVVVRLTGGACGELTGQNSFLL